ncbi:hypothetical protein K4F52_001326 [Lecanicillium sp. MT-2017a]|nr:hypothetical protein K4F52_001326 [Lecanicillium sp. MT-2017a]
MVSTAGGIVIAIVVLLIAAAVGWIVFTQLRARRLGLPAPSLASYLPWNARDNPYGPPRPATGGIVGIVNAQIRKFKNRNNRSAAGAYEPTHPGGAGSGPRGFGPLDPDEAWDARVGTEADTYGYYEEELAGRDSTAYAGGSGGGGGSYNMNLAATPGRESPTRHDDDLERGRQTSRSPTRATGGKNPFDDDNADSLRGVSPRPMDNSGR